MKFISFKEWSLIKESKKRKRKKNNHKNDFVSGKNDKIIIPGWDPVSTGHKPHSSGSGFHDKREPRQKQKENWKKETEN
jgi:hypothetical protein